MTTTATEGAPLTLGAKIDQLRASLAEMLGVHYPGKGPLVLGEYGMLEMGRTPGAFEHRSVLFYFQALEKIHGPDAPCSTHKVVNAWADGIPAEKAEII
jgi:hypothetical protein